MTERVISIPQLETERVSGVKKKVITKNALIRIGRGMLFLLFLNARLNGIPDPKQQEIDSARLVSTQMQQQYTDILLQIIKDQGHSAVIHFGSDSSNPYLENTVGENSFSDAAHRRLVDIVHERKKRTRWKPGEKIVIFRPKKHKRR